MYSFNELTMPVPARRIWPWLVRAAEWPAYYANARDVRFVSSGGPELEAGTVFRWRTFGVPVETRVEELVPFERLSWSGRGLGARGFHAWILVDEGERCRVVTEEAQRGFVPSLCRLAFRRMLQYQHQRWLEGLEKVSIAGPPRG